MNPDEENITSVSGENRYESGGTEVIEKIEYKRAIYEMVIDPEDAMVRAKAMEELIELIKKLKADTDTFDCVELDEYMAAALELAQELYDRLALNFPIKLMPKDDGSEESVEED